VRASLLFSVAVASFSIVLGGCAEDDTSVFRIIDSGVQAWDHERPYWLDDNRVLFVGYSGSKPKSREESRRMFPSLYIWEVDSRKVTLYRENARGLCYVNGFVRYIIPEKNEVGGIANAVRGWYEGPLGREIYTEGKGYRNAREGWRFSEHSCTYRRTPDFLVDSHWIDLRPADGFLEMGSIRGNQAMLRRPIKLHSVNGNVRELSFSGFSFSRAEYFSTTRRYLLVREAGCVEPEDEGNLCDVIWWLDRDGESEAVSIPRGPWANGGSVRYHPLKEGVFLVSHAFKSTHESGAAGGYLLKAEIFEKVVSGNIRALGISRSGCNIALSHHESAHPRPGERWHWFTLKATNVCELS
jgi:hypothetical protein